MTVNHRSLRSWPGSLKARAAKQVYQSPKHPGQQGHELLSEGFTSRTVPQGLQNAKYRITPKTGGGWAPCECLPQAPIRQTVGTCRLLRSHVWTSPFPEKPTHLPTLPTQHTNTELSDLQTFSHLANSISHFINCGRWIPQQAAERQVC